MGSKTKALIMTIAVVISLLILGYLYQTKIDRTGTIYYDVDSTDTYMIFTCPDNEKHVIPKPENVNSAIEQSHYIKKYCGEHKK